MSTTLIWAFVCLIIFVAVLASPETSELDDIYLHGSRVYWQSYGGKRYLCGCLTAPACI